jgi:hypothetical protein
MKRFLSVAAGLSIFALRSIAFADEPAAGSSTPPASAAIPPASTLEHSKAAAAAAAPPDNAPVVELSADDGRATIERRAATTGPTVPLLETGILSVGHWEHACIAPCQLKLDPRYAYRVAGDGLVPTDSFALPRGQERVKVDAKMGSSTGRTIGVLSTVGGALAIVGGGLALAATPILENEEVGSKGFRSAVLAGGIGFVSLGVVAASVGLFLWLTNGSSAHTEPGVPKSQASNK